MIAERELLDAEITSNKFLAGLAAQHGAGTVREVGLQALGYPASLVGSFAEVEIIQKALTDRS